MRTFRYLVLIACVLLTLYVILDQVSGLAGRGGGKGGGGGRGGGSRGGGLVGKVKGKLFGGGGGGSKSKVGSAGAGSYAGYGKKKGKFSTLKKAAVIGAVAYGGYQLGKLSSKFAGWDGGLGYGFDDWNRWREVDGFLCRNNQDCNWIDPGLYCQDYELDFEPSALWFGGDAARIVGECACPVGESWDDDEMACESHRFGGINLLWAVLIPLAVILGCCLGIGCLLFRKFFRR